VEKEPQATGLKLQATSYKLKVIKEKYFHTACGF
jgi:hypothetical protein